MSVKSKPTLAQMCNFDNSDAFTVEDFNKLLAQSEVKTKTVPPLCLLILGDTGAGKTSIATKTLHDDMLPALYIYSFKENHNFSFPDKVKSICFELKPDGSRITDPEECYNRLLRIIYSPAMLDFKCIILDSLDLDHLIWNHSFVIDAGPYNNSSVAKELYATIVNRLKELNTKGIHFISIMGVSIETDTGKARPWLRGKAALTIASWFADRLVIKMMEDPTKETIQPTFTTKTLIEKPTTVLDGIKEDGIDERGRQKFKASSTKVTNMARARLRDLDTKPLDLKPASIKSVWNYIVKQHNKNS